ncbi:MAG: saccharopine dehydrogenase C-terminal domain-containing protein [Planctomycetota bacterium]
MPHRVIVVGAGLVGSHLARLLAAERDLTVTVADVNQTALDAVASPQIRTLCANLLTPDQTARFDDFDLVVGAVPGALGLRLLEVAINAGKRVVDISFSPEDPFTLRQLAVECGVPIIVDCGLAPGLSNLAAGRSASKLAKTERIEILVGGLPVVRRYPFNYQAVFAPSDVIEEYVRPARFVENSRMVVREALSDIELHEFAGIGTLESFNTDGLRTLIHTLDAPEMKEKTLRFPGHAALMHQFRTAGFFSGEAVTVKTADGGTAKVRPVDLTEALFRRSWARPAHEEEFSVLRVDVDGTTNDGRRVRHRYELLDRTTDGVSSMARTTATPAAIVAAGMLRGELTWPAPGVWPPELLADNDTTWTTIQDRLAAHGIRLTFNETALPPAPHAPGMHHPAR